MDTFFPIDKCLFEEVYNITISNLKNNKPNGPIKTLANELSKFTMTVLVDEYNTSQVCPICKECKVEHPIMDLQKEQYEKHLQKEQYEKHLQKEQYENKLKDSQLEMLQYKILLLQNNNKI